MAVTQPNVPSSNDNAALSMQQAPQLDDVCSVALSNLQRQWDVNTGYTSSGRVSPESAAYCHRLIDELAVLERDRPELSAYLPVFLDLPNFAGALVRVSPGQLDTLNLEPTDDYWQLRQGIEENSLEILGDLYQRMVQAYADEEQQHP